MRCSGSAVRARVVGARLLVLLVGPLTVALVAVLAFSLAGCSGSGGGETLEERVDSYYSALVRRELAAAYELEHSMIREAISLEEYVDIGNSGGIPAVESFTVSGTSVEGDRALVKLELVFVAEGETRTSSFNDTWVQEDGRWYHSPN